LTLNAIGGVGMLAVGVLGFPFIGLLQVGNVSKQLSQQLPEIHDSITENKSSILWEYRAVVPAKVAALPPDQQQAIKTIEEGAKKGALAYMAIFPCIMFTFYLALIAY